MASPLAVPRRELHDSWSKVRRSLVRYWWAAALGAAAVPEEALITQGLLGSWTLGGRKIEWKVSEPLGVLKEEF